MEQSNTCMCIMYKNLEIGTMKNAKIGIILLNKI